MKPIKKFLIALFAIGLGVTASAQTHDHMNMNTATSKTETIKVWGNCNMCKARIEKAVKDDGATSADWNVSTKMLEVAFDPTKTSIESLSKKLAGVGHDTESLKAEDKVYDGLPACCKYERTSAKMVADYTCPMHSDVHSDKPGKCPKCGMALVKKEAKTKTGKSMQGMESMH